MNHQDEYRKLQSGKAPLKKIDPHFIAGMAFVQEFGDKKYGESDWMKGLAISDVIESTERHIAAMKGGQDLDPDTGYLHAYHVANNMMYFAWFHRNGKMNELDDRPYKGSVDPAEGLSDDAILAESIG